MQDDPVAAVDQYLANQDQSYRRRTTRCQSCRRDVACRQSAPPVAQGMESRAAVQIACICSASEGRAGHWGGSLSSRQNYLGARLGHQAGHQNIIGRVSVNQVLLLSFLYNLGSVERTLLVGDPK